ncbi:MAG: reverse transcriptase family protein, partial [Candidatus Omnitrophica bacterium]|nr:reverse transcriptase family protein [Candidatus Omnitrophota bacterium]
MGHALKGGPLANKGIEVQNVYAEIHNGSDSVPLVVRNKTAETVRISRKQPIARVTLANRVPPPQLKPGTWETLKEKYNIGDGKDPDEAPRMTVEERQQKLLEQLDLSGLDKWSPKAAQAARDLLMEYHDIFALEPNEVGCVSDVKHEIRLTDSKPYKDRFSNIPKPMVDEVRQHLREMLEAGAIRPSQSPWNNAIVLVRKKDGGLRFCIDFRKLNEQTEKDSHPLLRINDALDRLVGAKHFSTLDLKSGFWQIEMDEESKKYTAFSAGNFGFFECNRMPFGLCNAPATFQRCMQNCLGELNLTYALIYLDDIIVFSEDEYSHLDRLRKVFGRMREFNMKLKPSKCKFFQEEIDFLAHDVTKDGI